jgi:anti-sigma regulatory factor (Ser/Thr protein kinase)
MIEPGSDAFRPPVVHLKLESTPETLTLVRGVLGALAELLALDPELLDDMKTAISEACNNVVLHAYGGDAGPLEVVLCASPTAIAAVIRDDGWGIPDVADPDDGVHGVGMPLIKALTDDVQFIDREAGGTEVRMSFAGRRGEEALFSLPEGIADSDGWMDRLQGDVVGSLSPVTFLGPVLGRLARALAARARFSLDRFSDVYLVTDAIAAHTGRTASHARVGFSIATGARRLEIIVGPLRDGSGDRLQQTDQNREPASALLALSDAVQSQPVDGGELLSVLMTDSPTRLVPAQ